MDAKQAEHQIVEKNFSAKALIDSGSQYNLIDKRCVAKHALAMKPLRKPIKIRNADMSINAAGFITHYVYLDIKIGEDFIPIRFFVTSLGREDIFLGYAWLRRYNPIIDWEKSTVTIPKQYIKKTLEQVMRKAMDKNLPVSYGDPSTVRKVTLEEEEEKAKEDPTEIGAFRTQIEEIWARAKMSIAQKLQHKEMDAQPEKSKVELPGYLNQYRAVFEKEASERLPERRIWDHAIDLKPDFVPKDCKVYPLNPEEQTELDKFIKENLSKGYIQPSKSPMASPFFFVAKKDSKKLRPCQDYRALNDGTIKNSYPLPRVGDLLDKLKGKKYFTKLDLRWGYNNVRIKEGDEWKAAFKTNRGLFEPTVMFFGLCNSPATFQTMMNNILIAETDEGWLLIYMDDLLITGETLEELRENTKSVLEILEKNDLFCNLDKCTFEVEEVDYLGMVISHNKIGMEPTKVKGIRDWPTPQNVKQVRSFLGFGNFYRRFIGHFAETSRPLIELTRKKAEWVWTEECQEAFDTLKEKFLSAPVLLMPDSKKPFIVESDASKCATGAVIRQKGDDGEWHPCGYISQSFDATQRNYEIYDRELLGIIRALETWRHYLMGSPFPTIILSDHKNLTYFKTARKLNRRQARWSLYLSEFDLRLVHQPGSKMIQSDALSRRPDHMIEDHDNEDVILLPDSLFVRRTLEELKETLKEKIKDDEFVSKAIESLKTSKIPPIKSKLEDWEIRDGLLFYQNRCYVPPHEGVQRELTQYYHDTAPAGHPGHLKTLELLRRNYWWPGMYIFVKNYVKGCAICQQMKVNTHPTSPGLYPIKAESNGRPFANVTCDFITDLPLSNGFDSVMVVVDHSSTKGVTLIPCNKTVDAEKTAELFIQNVYRRFGLPDSFLSDRGPQFAAKVFKELGRMLGVKLKMSTAYHPQTDGETERVNQELETYLRIFCAAEPDSWANKLALAEFCHNQRIHSVTKKSPFYLMMGYEPRDIPLIYDKSDVMTADDRMKQLTKARDEALAAHELARQTMANRSRRGFTPFQVGDKVWLESRNLNIRYESRKLAPKREGPFAIKKVLGPVTYMLDLPQHWKIHPVFHASLLSPYSENPAHGPNYIRPPPDLISGEEQYELEAIVTHKRAGSGYKYLIKWSGYPSSENTWQTERDLKGAREALSSYKKRHRL